MADVFEDRADLVEPRRRLFRLIEATTWLDYMLLSKRPENMLKLAAEAGWPGDWPSNAWAGVTAENQELLEKRWPLLAKVPARVHFLSCEPLLGPIELKCNGCGHDVGAHLAPDQGGCSAWFPDLIITGAESGHGARKMAESWVRSLRDQCAWSRGRIKFFYKQKADDRGRKVSLPMLDGRQWAEMPS
jgi:protein gp37